MPYHASSGATAADSVPRAWWSGDRTAAVTANSATAVAAARTRHLAVRATTASAISTYPPASTPGNAK